MKTLWVAAVSALLVSGASAEECVYRSERGLELRVNADQTLNLKGPEGQPVACSFTIADNLIEGVAECGHWSFPIYFVPSKMGSSRADIIVMPPNIFYEKCFEPA